MRRVAVWVVALHVGVAAVGHVRERLGMVTCGCADDCWCKRPGLSFFRWVFPRGHKSSWAGKPNPVV